MTITGNTYLAASTTYDFWINRRPSDGRITTYLKGGAYTAAQLMSASGGGANPTAAETTYTTSQWISVNMQVGDKLLMLDPADSRAGIQVYQCVLNPVNGEVP